MKEKIYETLEKMETKHLMALREMYCRPDRLRLEGENIVEEMRDLGLHHIEDVAGRKPITDFARLMVSELHSVGKWPPTD